MKKIITRVHAKIMEEPHPDNGYCIIAEGDAKTIYGYHFYAVYIAYPSDVSGYKLNLQESMHLTEDDINEVLVIPTEDNGYEPYTNIIGMDDMDILKRYVCLKAKLEAINIAYIHSDI